MKKGGINSTKNSDEKETASAQKKQTNKIKSDGQQKNGYQQKLAELIYSAQSLDELAGVLTDLLSQHELESISKRVEIISDLLEGKTVEVIASERTVAKETVSRARRLMSSGQTHLVSLVKRFLSQKINQKK